MDPARQPLSLVVTGSRGDPLHVAFSEPSTAGVPVLFVHGYSLSSSVWTQQLQSGLAGRHQFLAMDLRGHGRSSPTAEGMDDPEVWAGDVHAVLDSFGIDACLVVAWSYGGIVLGDFLAHGGADRVAGVMLVAAAPKVAPLSEQPPGDAFFDLVPQFWEGDRRRRDAALRQYVRLLARHPLPDETVEHLVGVAADVLPGVQQALLNRAVDHLSTFQKLSVPARLLHGVDDALLPVSVSQAVCDVIDEATLSLIDDCGHAPFLEHPERFEEELQHLLLTAG